MAALGMTRVRPEKRETQNLTLFITHDVRIFGNRCAEQRLLVAQIYNLLYRRLLTCNVPLRRKISDAHTGQNHGGFAFPIAHE